MILRNLFKRSTRESHGRKGASSGKTLRDVEHTALFQISSAIKSQKDLHTIYEVIARESARCLRADRSTVFLVDGTKGYLKTQITYSPDPSAEKAGLLEEKEAARKAITEKRPLLLKEPQDFSDFYKFGGKDRKLSSHMSIPFGFQGKVMGTLSLSLLNGKRHFTERDLQFLLIFSNHACIALQHHHLVEEIRKATILRKNYEQYLDDLSGQLQNLSVGERRRIDDHIVKFLSGLNPEKKAAEYQQGMVSGGGNGAIRLVGEMRFEGDTEPLPEKVIVEIEGRSGKANIDLNNAGVFIPTPYPRDLGEQFFLKLHLSESQPVEVPCKVIFTNKYGKESENLRRGMGIKFIDPTPEIQKLFDEYLQAQKDGDTPQKKEAQLSSEPTQPSEAKEEGPSSLPLKAPSESDQQQDQQL